jgi:hypothetical protein
MEASMKKTRMYLLGSSVLGLALCAATSAQAGAPEPDVKVEETTVETTATVEPAVAAPAPPEEKDRPRGLYVGGTVGGSFFEGPGNNSRIFNHTTGDVNQDGAVVADDASAVKRSFFRSVTNEGSDADSYSLFRDVNGSGAILADDFSEVKKRFFTRLPNGEPAAAGVAVARNVAPLRTRPVARALFADAPLLG